MSESLRPPRGWLWGVIATILVAFFSATTWSTFRRHEINAVKFSGAVIMILSLAIMAHEALTNDDYKTSKRTVIGQRFMSLGVILFVVGSFV